MTLLTMVTASVILPFRARVSPFHSIFLPPTHHVFHPARPLPLNCEGSRGRSNAYIVFAPIRNSTIMSQALFFMSLCLSSFPLSSQSTILTVSPTLPANGSIGCTWRSATILSALHVNVSSLFLPLIILPLNGHCLLLPPCFTSSF